MSWTDAILGAQQGGSEISPEDLERYGRFFCAAAPLCAAGANVLPVLPGEKSPALSGWGTKPAAGSDRSLVLEWRLAPEHSSLHSTGSPRMALDHVRALAGQFRDYNALWFPATLDLTVIDVDDPTLLDQVIEALGDTPYRVESGRVGGGTHLIYRGAVRSRNGIIPGVDVKSSRGYAIAPGSIHAMTGREYRSSPAFAADRACAGAPALRSDWIERLRRIVKGCRRPTRLDLATLADQLHEKARTREIAKRLRKAARGESPADFGERDGALYAMLAVIAEHWPNAETDAIVALFEPSLRLWEREDEQAGRVFGAEVTDWCAEKWERLAGAVEAERTEHDERDAARRAWAWSLVGEDRDDPAELGTEPIVVHRGRTFWMRLGRSWSGPHTRDDLGPDMLGAIRALYGVDVPDAAALLSGYGQVLREIRHSYTQQTGLHRGVLTVQVAPMRPLEPARSVIFDRAIDALAGPYAEQLRQWLAGLVALEHPCRALVLSGEPGIGKSLILAGLGRLWEHGAQPLDQIVGKQFNAALLESPFAIADDEDSAQNGEALAKYIRAAVSARTQTFERKFHDVGRLEGSIRIAVGTNDPAEFISGAVSHRLNDASVDAFAQRLLHIPCQSEGRGWWGDDPARFVQGDEIARHVWWLAERYRTPRGRFWVQEGDQSLAALVQLSTGLRGDILLRIAEGGTGVELVGDTYHVATRAFVGAWEIGKPRGLSLRTGGQALKALAHAVPMPRRISPSGATEHPISAELVRWYAERCGL